MSFLQLKCLFAAAGRLLVAFVIITVLNSYLFAQTVKPLPNGMCTDKCEACEAMVLSKPKEVLFGISIREDGSVIFSMSSLEWFNKIFPGSRDGITVDLVTKDQYKCGATVKEGLPRGSFLRPVYLSELQKNMMLLGGGNLMVTVGVVPEALHSKELEGNLVILRNGAICYYQDFVNIDRSFWNLLPMGLYADTLIQGKATRDGENPLLFSREMQLTVPFGRNKTAFDASELTNLQKVLQMNDAHIVKIDIRAYSSVEGAAAANDVIQKKRAAAVIKGLQQYQPTRIQSEITASENWVEFYNDVTDTPFDELSYLSREEVKKRLQNPKLLSRIEPILSKHRKAVISVYLDKNTGMERVADSALAWRFNQAVAEKDLSRAGQLQREIFTRIGTARLPADYANKLELPAEKDFLFLLINREAYMNQLGLHEELETLNAFKKLLLLDADNGKIRYNICALTCNIWRYDTTLTKPWQLLADIKALTKYGIDKTLIQRMLVNYYILVSEWHMSREEYDAKDKTVDSVVHHYSELQLNDKELLSLARYLCAYSRMDEADSLLAPRASRIDVSENLLFYYLNLKLFNPSFYETDQFESLVLNAVSINRKRFCKLFSSINKGGVSFQLLEYEVLRDMHCEYCKP
jgi:hypothetical protein